LATWKEVVPFGFAMPGKVSKPSYMAIKKALYGRQPGCFCFDFL
jgi:hypothetical protein